MKIPHLIWSSCVVSGPDGMPHDEVRDEMGHCRVQVYNGQLRIDEDSPPRGPDGRPVGGLGGRNWLYQDAVLVSLDERGAVFDAKGWSVTYAEGSVSEMKTWPVRVILLW